MPKKLQVGPILGLYNQTTYTVCFVTTKGTQRAIVPVEGEPAEAEKVAELADGSEFWLAQIAISPAKGERGLKYDYKVQIDGEAARDQFERDSWEFYVPGKKEEPKIAYASCNGVSKSDLLAKMSDPFRLWYEMRQLHNKPESTPFSLLLMGGDQVYADAIWDKVKELEDWSSLPLEKQRDRKANKNLSRQLDNFYCKLYRERWCQDDTAYMLASVPSLMMWDDHDIFDGWGSFPEDLQNCDIFKEIFHHARRYFELFQLRSLKNNTSLLSPEGQYYSFCLKFRDYRILGLDHRSERSITQIMSNEHWSRLIECLDGTKTGTLLVMSAVPVVYRDFSFTETAFDITPWDEGLTDDLKDHWRAKEHQQERSRFIMRLLENAADRRDEDESNKTIILSGDVHVGCLGVVNDRTRNQAVKLHQVVSSGIVHPAPSLLEWLGIRAVTNDDDEILNEEGTIEARMLKPVSSDRYIRKRNFVTLERGTDNKVWVNWIVDSGERGQINEEPVYPIA